MTWASHLWWVIVCGLFLPTGHYLKKIIGMNVYFHFCIKWLLALAALIGFIHLVPVVYRLAQLIPGVAQ